MESIDRTLTKNEGTETQEVITSQEEEEEDDVGLNELNGLLECRSDTIVDCSSILPCGGFGSMGPNAMDKEEEEKIWKSSDLTLDRYEYIWIVTTAALPWRTGTAMNPLLRALYLIKMFQESKKEVTLVIPWLSSVDDRREVYKGHSFETMHDQEEWIRNYARTSCHLTEESKQLNILFYPATYWASFGSIFPLVDICSMIPKEKAHVAILEEPEHLNWLRLPNHSTYSSPQQQEHSVDRREEKTNIEAAIDEKESQYDDQNKGVVKKSDRCSSQEMDLGWAQRFDFVVGILHTNYSAYMKQYAIMGTSIIGAPALRALSSWVIQAYCHVVIRLSDVLPSYDPLKERTCNVHGVRQEFICSDQQRSIRTKGIYFIGKLLWAKGFGQLLAIQEECRKTRGHYFSMDIIGSGPDEYSIQRAFHGRLPLKQQTPSPPKITEEDDNTKDHETPIMTHPESLRSQLLSLFQKRIEKNGNTTPYYYQDAQQYLNIGFEVTSDDINYVLEEKEKTKKQKSSLLQDVSHHSFQTTIQTTKAVKTLANTAMSMVFRTESIPNDTTTTTTTSRRSSISSTSCDTNNCTSEKGMKQKLVLDLPKSRFELRRYPIPAQFLGVKDHASLRDEYTIFLNPSISEVLCTTTAEALAMGKFVILPLHSSNDFFLQFPNCYSYKSTEECLEHLDYCQTHDPIPLTKEYRHLLSWEAATERLIQSCLLKHGQLQNHHCDKDDNTLAWLHTHSTENVAKLFRPTTSQPNAIQPATASTSSQLSRLQ